MTGDTVIAAQIALLLRKHQSATVWELIEANEPAREGDVILYHGDGTPAGYARPAI